MIRIGIIDDDSFSRDNLKQELARYASEYKIKYEAEEYDSALSFLNEEREFHILFLDIDMPGMSGMELAEKIREKKKKVVIIFCTNLQQLAINGYSVGALGFMIKPVQSYIFDLNMNRARTIVDIITGHENEDSESKIMLKDGNISRLVKTQDIDYIEVRQHYLWYNIKDSVTGERNVIKNRGSMQETIKRFSEYGFVRCSSSFLVNLKSVTAVSKMNVYIGDEVLPIGRTFKDEFMDAFSRYLAKKEWENPW